EDALNQLLALTEHVPEGGGDEDADHALRLRGPAESRVVAHLRLLCGAINSWSSRSPSLLVIVVSLPRVRASAPAHPITPGRTIRNTSPKRPHGRSRAGASGWCQIVPPRGESGRYF